MDEPERPPTPTASLVSMRQPSPHRQRDVTRYLGGHRLSTKRRRARYLRPRRSLDELHRHVELATFFAEIDNLHQVRVGELGAQARFVDEHRNEFGVGGKLRQDAL